MVRLKSSEFLIATNTKKLIFLIKKHTENIPRKDIILKDSIRKVSLDIYYNIMRLNFLEINEDKYHIKADIKASISYLDFLIEVLFKEKYITQKAMSDILHKIYEIDKMLYKWFKRVVDE